MDEYPFYYECDEFTFMLEPYDGYFFIHNDVRVWSIETQRRIQEILDELGASVDLRVFCDPDDSKLLWYCGLFGWTYSYTTVCPYDGEDKFILTRSIH
jgi:hypothetical protein